MPNSMDYNPTNLNQESTATRCGANLTGVILNQTLEHQYNSTQHQHGNIHTTSSPDLDPAPPPLTMTHQPSRPVRYQECLKNHAASSGGNVLDGCCEFMPDSMDENTPEAYKCAACGCHRNFHRKLTYSGLIGYHSTVAVFPTTDTNNIIHQQPSFPLLPAQPRRFVQPSRGPVMMAFGGGTGGPAESSRSSEDLNIFHPNAETQLQIQQQQQQQQSSRKRFRTKFSHQQKQKMSEFAERVGWRIQKQDEQEVGRFCEEVGVKRQVFKVWMHNNKQAMKKKQM